MCQDVLSVFVSVPGIVAENFKLFADNFLCVFVSLVRGLVQPFESRVKILFDSAP